MEWGNSFFIPIIQFSLYLLVIGGFLFLIYRRLKKRVKNVRLWIKYKIFKKWPEQTVEDCIGLLEKGYDVDDLERELVLTNTDPKTINELKYIFEHVQENYD